MKKRRRKSIRSMILMYLFGGFMLIVGVILADHAMSNNILKQETAVQYESILEDQVSSLDQKLKEEASTLTNYAVNNMHAMDMEKSATYNDYFHATVLMRQDFKTVFSSYMSEGIFFIHEIDGKIYQNVHSNATMDSLQKKNMVDYVRQMSLDTNGTRGIWVPVQIGDQWYFMYKIMGRKYAMGLFVSADTLAQSLGLTNTDFGTITFLNNEGQAVIGADFMESHEISAESLTDITETYGYVNNNLIVKTDSTMMGRQVYYLREDAFSGNIRRILVLMEISIALIILICGAMFTGIYSLILLPLEILKKRIYELRQGNFNAQPVPEAGVPLEFATTLDVFNEMTSEIRDLKIDAYEKELQSRNYEIQFLSMQIEPHFYLNSMKYLYALAQRKQIDMIQSIVLKLSGYFRYLTYDSAKMVPLAKELEHADNYVSITKSGTEADIDVLVSIDQRAETVEVPKLLVQTFIENAIKYGIPDDGCICIKISARIVSDEEDYLLLTIGDDGRGYQEEYLENYNRNGFTDEGGHVGLANLYHRLQLLYGEKAQMSIHNNEDGGASAVVVIPIDMDKEKTGK